MTERNQTYHLAQINIARMKAPLDDPQMQAFVAGLEPINALADKAPGFVWRLQTEAGDATELRPYPDDFMIVNMSVWDSVESLREYTYKTAHVQFVRRRKEWFEELDQPIYALWWQPAGGYKMEGPLGLAGRMSFFTRLLDCFGGNGRSFSRVCQTNSLASVSVSATKFSSKSNPSCQ